MGQDSRGKIRPRWHSDRECYVGGSLPKGILETSTKPMEMSKERSGRMSVVIRTSPVLFFKADLMFIRRYLFTLTTLGVMGTWH